jgi:hypothetical protein
MCIVFYHNVSSNFYHSRKELCEIYFSELMEMQQVYMYFRGSGKEAEMKREAARGALRNAF